MAVALQQPRDSASEFATLAFQVQQALARVQTLTLVRVVACSNEGGIVPVGTVTVQPLVNLMSADRVAFEHAPLYNLPYLRVQGGVNAIIMDPQPNDIGLAGFCSRDISAVKATKAKANPGSFRQFDYADGVYIGGCLNGVPTQYVVLNDDGVKIVSPTAITLQAPTITLDGNVEVTGDETVQGEVTAGTIALTTHTHSGVQAGGGNSGPPVP